MAALKDLLPPAKSTSASFYDHSKDPWFRDRFNSSASESVTVVKAKPVPPYGKRQHFIPRKPKDSGDGGAFPEIHIAQHPLGMGRKDEKIPPCISNWKNQKGHTIPLDKRLAADGRGLQDVQINDNFAKLSEALYVAEQRLEKLLRCVRRSRGNCC